MILLSRLIELINLKLIVVDKKATIRYHPWFNKNWDNISHDVKEKLSEWSPNNDPKEACFYYLHNVKLLEPFKCVICNTNITRFIGFEFYPRPFNYVCHNKECQVKFKDLQRSKKTIKELPKLKTYEERLQWLIDNNLYNPDRQDIKATNLALFEDKSIKKQKIYNWLYDIKEMPKCPICQERPKAFIGFKKGYGKTCNDKYCQAEYSRRVVKEKYGVNTPSKIPGVYEKVVAKLRSKEYFIQARTRSYNFHKERLLKEGYELLTTLDEFIENRDIKKVKCLKCGNIFNYDEDKRCLKCYPVTQSNQEREILALINKWHDGKIYSNYKKLIAPYEVDIYIPDKRFAIEFNGSYWHTHEKLKKAEYHYQKTQLCMEKGVRLIHIFEYEWVDAVKRSKIESFLHSFFISKDIIPTRKVMIKEIDNDAYRYFTDTYHLDGYKEASIKLGMFYKNELVSVIGISKSRFTSYESYEIVRLVVPFNIYIPNVVDKFMSYIVNKYSYINNIITYVDLCKFTGHTFDNSKYFKFSHISHPSYIYINLNNGQIVTRYQAQKHKLKDLLGDLYDESLSEYDNMKNAGFSKIYDCGNKVYVWKRQ